MATPRQRPRGCRLSKEGSKAACGLANWATQAPQTSAHLTALADAPSPGVSSAWKLRAPRAHRRPARGRRGGRTIGSLRRRRRGRLRVPGGPPPLRRTPGRAPHAVRCPASGPRCGASAPSAADEAAEFQDWKERCVKAKTVLFSPIESLRSPYTLHMLEVSAHTIQRFLQRSPVGFREGAFRLRDLLDEVRPLANWAGFDSWFLTVSKMPPGAVLFPIVPSRHGLYLCNARTSKAAALSVRTFVAAHQLRPEQEFLRDRLYESMQWARRVPYFAVPHISGTTVDALAYVFLLHLRRLQPVWRDWSSMLATGDQAPSPALASLMLANFQTIVHDTSDLVSGFSNRPESSSGYDCFREYGQSVRSGRMMSARYAISSEDN